MIRKEMRDKIEFYFKDKKQVHITCNNERFYNGTIIKLNENRLTLVLNDNKLGAVFLSFSEIKNIEPFMDG